MKSILLPVLAACYLLAGCVKSEKNCQFIENAKITANDKVTIGDEIVITTNEVGGNRVYEWRGPNNFSSMSPRVSISDAQLENEGWYYLRLSNNECNTKYDSVYIDVQLQQGTPGCSQAVNTCGYSNLFDDTYTSVEQDYDPTYQFLSLEASGTSTIKVFFHDYWKTNEPEDGVYTTTNVPSFSFDDNYNKVYISTIKQSVFFASHEGQTVYVSHVNGKLQVRFCNLSMGGYNGTSFTTLASGNLVEK